MLDCGHACRITFYPHRAGDIHRRLHRLYRLGTDLRERGRIGAGPYLRERRLSDCLWRLDDADDFFAGGLGRDADCRDELGRDADWRDDELLLTFGADRRVVVVRGCVARTVVSRISRSRGLTNCSREGLAGVLRDFEVRDGARLATLLRWGETLFDDGRWRNSMGSRFERLIDVRSVLRELVL